jgi:hypothetical protein
MQLENLCSGSTSLGEKKNDDYLKLCKQGTCMVMQTKAWVTNFLFKLLLFFFERLIPSGISFAIRHLLILDGHGSHVTLKALSKHKHLG